MLYGYTMILAGELRAARIPIPPSPQIPSRGPIIPPYEPGNMPIPPGPPGGLSSFVQTSGPSSDPRYAPSTSGDAGPSISPFVVNDDDDDNDINQYIRGDDSP